MLVISLKEGEAIQIGNAVVRFNRLRSGRRVTLAIDAPKEVGIVRLGNGKEVKTATEPLKVAGRA